MPITGFGISSSHRMTMMQRGRALTDAAGNLTWVYPVPFAAGVVPVITAVSEAPSGIVPQVVQLVGAPTNTSATVKVMSLPTTTVLGVTVVGQPTPTQAFVSLIATNP